MEMMRGRCGVGNAGVNHRATVGRRGAHGGCQRTVTSQTGRALPSWFHPINPRTIGNPMDFGCFPTISNQFQSIPIKLKNANRSLI